MYEVKEQKLDNLINILNSYIKNLLEYKKQQYNNITSKYILKNPLTMYEKKEHQFQLLLNKITILNPLKILEKGYSVVECENNIINSTENVKIDDVLNIKLSKGNLKAKVTEIGKDDE